MDHLPTDQPQGHTRFALTHLPSQLRLWLSAVCLLVLDLWSKQWAFRSLDPNGSWQAIPGFLEFRRSLNHGAVFGTFAGFVGLFIAASFGALIFVLYIFAHSPRTHRVLHVSLGLILAGALGNLYDRIYMQAEVVDLIDASGEQVSLIGRVTSKPDAPIVRVEHWPEGGIARTFNRNQVTIRRQGVVRDFIKFEPRFPDWVPKLAGRDMWPWIFNVADAALVCGVITLLFHSLFDRKAMQAVLEQTNNSSETGQAAQSPLGAPEVAPSADH